MITRSIKWMGRNSSFLVLVSVGSAWIIYVSEELLIFLLADWPWILKFQCWNPSKSPNCTNPIIIFFTPHLLSKKCGNAQQKTPHCMVPTKMWKCRNAQQKTMVSFRCLQCQVNVPDSDTFSTSWSPQGFRPLWPCLSREISSWELKSFKSLGSLKHKRDFSTPNKEREIYIYTTGWWFGTWMDYFPIYWG